MIDGKLIRGARGNGINILNLMTEPLQLANAGFLGSPVLLYLLIICVFFCQMKLTPLHLIF